MVITWVDAIFDWLHTRDGLKIGDEFGGVVPGRPSIHHSATSFEQN